MEYNANYEIYTGLYCLEQLYWIVKSTPFPIRPHWNVTSYVWIHLKKLPLRSLALPVTGRGGRAVAEAVSRWLLTAAARVRVRAACEVYGGQRGRFSPSSSVSLTNHNSTSFSIIMITRGWHNRPISGRSAEWTQFDSTFPPLCIKTGRGDS
jgi:hypothetical protein